MKDALTWFEIPAENIDRAQRFYEDVLRVCLLTHGGGEPMRIFPAPEEAVHGALVYRPQQRPAMDGTTVYLRLEGDVDAAMKRVSDAGGSIVVPKMRVPGVPGEIFCLRDTEGNMVGVHGLGDVS